MSMMIGSAGSNVRRVSFRKAEGAGIQRMIPKKPNKPVRKKHKKFRYNFKEISARILRAKTSGNARTAVTLARSRAAMLRRQLKSGEYDSEDLENALLHAEKMVRIAKKRQKHLQEEERAKRAGSDAALDDWEEELQEETEEDTTIPSGEELTFGREELRELIEEMQRSMEEFMEDSMEETMELAEETGGIEELSEELTGNWKEMEPEDLEQRKKKHRADELREIMEADMKYLKALFDKLEKERADASGNVSLELGGVEMPALVAPSEISVMTEGGAMDVSV